METILKTAPTIEPVTLSEIKTHLGVTVNDDDAYITTLIPTARKIAENITNRKFITQTWTLYLDEWPAGDFINMPFGSLQTVTSVKYKDYLGTEYTMSASYYIVDVKRYVGRIVLAYGCVWPTETLYAASPIYIEYVCGYGSSAATVPEEIRQAIKFIITDLFENRQNITEKQTYDSKAADALLSNFRIKTFME